MFNKLKSIFTRETEQLSTINFQSIKVDMHSHLLPAIDDGVKTIEESIEILKYFIEKGYQKVITTPHIMHGTYDNTSAIIKEKCHIIQQEIQKRNLPILFEASAEYFLNAQFLDLMFNDDLLSFGKENYVLIELSYILKQNDFETSLLNLSQSKYQPILAHPERYPYFFDDKLNQYKEIKAQGVLFQLNLFSILGIYGNRAKITAEKLVKAEMIDFLGTDIHKPKHLEYLEACLQNKLIQQLLQSGKLKNQELL